jgi:hypothetical protein
MNNPRLERRGILFAALRQQVHLGANPSFICVRSTWWCCRFWTYRLIISSLTPTVETKYPRPGEYARREFFGLFLDPAESYPFQDLDDQRMEYFGGIAMRETYMLVADQARRRSRGHLSD